jgi:hypothetical protein
LPDPFLLAEGRRVETAEDWAKRRGEMTELLTRYEFGRMPPAPGNVTAECGEQREVFGGNAVAKDVILRMGPEGRLHTTVRVVGPRGTGPFPAIVRNTGCTERSPLPGALVEQTVQRGYLFAEYVRTDLQADNTADVGPAKALYPEYDWGTLGVWAWGGMRVIDWLTTQEEVDHTRIAVTGHSRGGKTALLTAALDERVALAVPNACGGGGFQCWRFPIRPTDAAGVNPHESVAVMSKHRTYWFHPGLKPFVDCVDRLPFDQHFLAALVAPRALCAVECMDDGCATPVCAQRSFQAARVVYEWLDASCKLGIYFRKEGGHAQGPEDWAALLDFADLALLGKPPAGGRRFDRLPYPDAYPGFAWRTPAPVTE